MGWLVFPVPFQQAVLDMLGILNLLIPDKGSDN
jgi:hypothetical protein